MIRHKISIIILLLFVSASLLFSQDIISSFQSLRGSSVQAIDTAKTDIPNRAAYVMLNTDYPVIPGDTYQISYLYNLKATNLPFFIDGDGIANLSFFGNRDTKGLTYRELKVNMEQMVTRAYPDSLPQLTIKSTGVFPVSIKGEVSFPGPAKAWGFSRLSDLIADRLTKYSSLRDIIITHADGTSESYDLFGAALKSDISKNPVIKPGDSITVKKYDKEIYIQGEVRREGSFQILEEENLTDLIDTYSNGLTKLADAPRIYILRLNTSNGTTETIYMDPENGNYNNIMLEDMDMVVVPAKTSKMPLVFFEGALGMKVGSTSPVSAKIPWPITYNQRISTAVLSLPDGSITPVSDLENSFIIRRGEADYIPVDLEKIIYYHDYSNDPVLLEGDRIVIPMKLFTVYVGGSVDNPSAVPYIAGKTYLEYIQMAGGFDRDEHIGSSVTIFDRDGNKHGKDRVIQPEDRIFAPRNSPEYYYNVKMGRYIVTTAAILALLLSLVDVQQTYF